MVVFRWKPPIWGSPPQQSARLELQPMDFRSKVLARQVAIDGGHLEGAVAEHRLEGDQAAAFH